MLYYLHLLQDWYSPLRVFRYITVRAVAGAGTAFLISLVIGPWVIERLRRMKTGQRENKEADMPFAELRKTKKGTPSMGGLLIISSILISSLLWAMPTSFHVWMVLVTMVYMGWVGFLDDRQKIRDPKSKGLRARTKLLLQAAWVLAIGAVLLTWPETRHTARHMMLPFLKSPVIWDLGIARALVFMALVILGSTNAVNLTDGLDGLAIGCAGSAAVSYLLMSYAAGHAAFAGYLSVPYVRGAGELAVFCGCLLGGALGFLWYNCHPAQVFMGDTGSLALGGSIAMVAILIKQELVLILVGGVFVMEAVSVILQVASFKLRGKRIFACTPLHHHFEMNGWSETQVTVRFWILSIIFALLGVLTLKIR